MGRRAFVALFASVSVLASVVGAGTVLGASNGIVADRDPGATLLLHISENWILSPGSIALLAASGFTFLRGRRP